MNSSFTKLYTNEEDQIIFFISPALIIDNSFLIFLSGLNTKKYQR